jgi:plasmid maintenance system antidote protein VapI
MAEISHCDPASVTDQDAPHPGDRIREALKDAGFSIPSAAVAMAVDRSNLNNMLLGKSALSRDMAYRLSALVDGNDEEFRFAREILAQQGEHQWEKDAAMRRVIRVAVNAGRKYGEMHEAGTDSHLTLTAVGLRQKRKDEMMMASGS